MTPGAWPERPGLRFLIQADLRRPCDGPQLCDKALDVLCTAQTGDHECGTIWRPADYDIPGPCPACAAELEYRKIRCESCPLTKLDESGATPEGSLLRRVSQIDFALQSKFTLDLADVTAEEFDALRVLHQEREKFGIEKARDNASRAN